MVSGQRGEMIVCVVCHSPASSGQSVVSQWTHGSVRPASGQYSPGTLGWTDEMIGGHARTVLSDDLSRTHRYDLDMTSI